MSQPINILPNEGKAYYYGRVYNESVSKVLKERLLKSVLWKNDEVVIFGKKITTKRKVAWYGDKEFSYKYSGKIKTAIHWNKDLIEIKKFVEALTKENYNSCLLNLYHDGDEGVSWHSDNEKELAKNAAIASLSLGAERRFVFKNKKTKDKYEQTLEDGSLLLMTGPIQDNWVHSLPKSKKIKNLRVNLTFRTINL